MTLRLAFGLLIGILLAISVTTRADFAPNSGVWDQLQNKGDQTVLAKIVEFDSGLNGVQIEYREVGMDSPGTKSIQLCRDNASDSSAAAVEYHHRIQSARDAFNSGEIVRLSKKGPWSPCLSAVVQLK